MAIDAEKVRAFWKQRASREVQHDGLTNLEPHKETRDEKIELEKQKVFRSTLQVLV